MTKSKAIKLHCFDCAGDSNKEVTLCPAFDCPLWPFRTGQGAGSRAYKSRVEIAISNYKDEIEAANLSRLADSCRLSSSKSRSVATKPPRPIHRAGSAKLASTNALLSK